MPRWPLQPLNKDEKRALAETVKIMDATIERIEAEIRACPTS